MENLGKKHESARENIFEYSEYWVLIRRLLYVILDLLYIKTYFFIFSHPFLNTGDDAK